MKKLVLAALAAALVSVMAIPLPAMAAGPATYGPDRIEVAQWFPRYRPYYRPYRPYVRPYVGFGIGAGILGFGMGAAVGRSIERSYDYDTFHGDHAARCADRYRSYDVRSDTFLGYDGYRHRCRL